jgi:predicted DNA-binding transcriptional regulator YafY
VFQELPTEVVLRFAPNAAADAAGWIFHPTQSTTRETDGSLTVKFLAGGTQEMCWHLFAWGTSVTIIAPETLKAQLSEMLADATAHHKAR